MKFFLPILLLVVVISFALFESNKVNKHPASMDDVEMWVLEDKLSYGEKSKVKFVEAKSNMESRDTIQLWEVKDNQPELYHDEKFMGERSKKEAYFLGDTIEMMLNVGFLYGYTLRVQVVGEEFTSILTRYDCTFSEKLTTEEQTLTLEEFELTEGRKMKGAIYCEATSKRSNKRIDKVIVKGYFEMDLVDVSDYRKLD